MKKTKHTDGPWDAINIKFGIYEIVSGNTSESIAWTTERNAGGCEEHEQMLRANAHLIAAAPDLLESLTKVMTILENNYQLWDEYVASGDVRNNPLANKKTQTIADLAYDSINKAHGKDL